jgi:hypothetical protein
MLDATVHTFAALLELFFDAPLRGLDLIESVLVLLV